MTAQNNPHIWNRLLKAAPPGSALMGGAIRDWSVQKDAKDFDIFHTYSFGVPEIPGWVYYPRDPLDEAKWAAEYDIPGLDGGNHIGSVYDYQTYIIGAGIIKIQLMGVHYADPIENLKNFDHSLTLGVYNHNGLFMDRKMLDDIDNFQVTCINNKKPDKSLLRAQNAVQKIDPEGAHNWTYQGF